MIVPGHLMLFSQPVVQGETSQLFVNEIKSLYRLMEEDHTCVASTTVFMLHSLYVQYSNRVRHLFSP